MESESNIGTGMPASYFGLTGGTPKDFSGLTAAPSFSGLGGTPAIVVVEPGPPTYCSRCGRWFVRTAALGCICFRGGHCHCSQQEVAAPALTVRAIRSMCCVVLLDVVRAIRGYWYSCRSRAAGDARG